jgi:hypothetical protein
MKKSEFKEYLKNEILREINEADEEIIDVETTETDDIEVDVKDEIVPGGISDTFIDLDEIGDQLVVLAKKAKDINELELSNQILNSAKFAKRTEFKDIDAGL